MAQRDQSLLDRIRSAGAHRLGSGAFDRHVAYESVRRNIERFCGARRGMASAQEDFGLPEVDFGFGVAEAVAQLRRIISENVRLFEPRLADVTVLPAEVSGGDKPAVLIEGRHVADPDGAYGAFVVIYESPGQVSVSVA